MIISSFIIKYYEFFKREMLQKNIILLWNYNNLTGQMLTKCREGYDLQVNNFYFFILAFLWTLSLQSLKNSQTLINWAFLIILPAYTRETLDPVQSKFSFNTRWVRRKEGQSTACNVDTHWPNTFVQEGCAKWSNLWIIWTHTQGLMVPYVKHL